MLKKLLIFIIVKTRRNSHVSHKNSKKTFPSLALELGYKTRLLYPRPNSAL